MPYANSGDSGYDDSRSRADMLFNPLAFDVCTPELIYEDGGLNIRLEAKRMGTVKYDNTECVPVFELHERPIYRDFKVALPRISVALKDTETQFKFFSKIGFASNNAHSSTGGSMLNSSELKLLENLKAIKKLPLYSYNHLNKDTTIYDYDVSNYSVIVDLDISKLLPTRVRCESIFNSELDIMESASRICKLQRQLAIVGSYCKKERIIPLAGNDFSSKEFLLRKPLSKIGVNPVTGEIGKKAKYPRVDGSIGIKFASKDRGATNIDEIVVSGQALDKAIERACELYRDSGKIDTVAESIRSAFIFGNDSDVDSVFCDGFNEKACNSIYVDLSSAKGFEILALFYLRKEIEKTKGKLYFNYLVYTVIANTKGRLNLELGKIAEYSLSRLIANRFKSFGNYDIDKEWALVADNGKSKVYEPSIGSTNLTMTLTGIELKKTASKDAMKSNDIIDFNMVPVTPNLNNPEAESLTRLFFKNIASLGDGNVLLINMDSKYKNYIKKDGDATVFSVGGIEVAQPVFKVGNDLSSTTLNLEFMRLGYIQTSGGKKLVSVPVTRCIFKDGKYTKLAQKLVLACSSSCTSKITELFSKSDDEEYKIFNEESLPSVVTGILRKFSSPNFPVASDGAFEYFTIDLSHTPITTSYGPFGVTEVSGARHIVVLRCRLDIFRTLYSGLSTELGKAGLAIDSEISTEEARKFGISLGERNVLNIEDSDSSPRRFLFRCSGLGNYSNLTSDFMRQMQESFDAFVGNGGGDDGGIRPSDTSDMPTEYALNYIVHMSKEIQADVENGGNKYTSKISERVMRAIKSLELWEACAAFYLYGFTIERKSNKFANILAALRECINCCEFGYSKLERYREKDWLTAKYNINLLYEAMEHLRKKGYIKIYKDKRLHITTDGKNKCTLGYTDKVENTREITIGLPFKMTDNEYDFS